MLNKIKENPFLKTLGFATHHTFRTGKGHWLAITLTQVISALIAPMAALLIGKLVSSIKEVISAPSPDLSILLPWMLLAVLISLILAACRIITQYSTQCLGDHLTLQMQHQVVEHITSLSLEQIEDRTIQDVLERAQQNPGKSLLTFMIGVLDVTAAIIRIIGLIGVIFWIAPLWAGIIALLCVPALAANRYLSHINFNIKRSRTTARRWSRYYSHVLTSRQTIPATVTMGLIPLFLKRFHETVLGIHEINRKFYRLRAMVNLGLAMLMIGILIAAFFAVAKDVSSGALSVGKFTAFWIAAWRIQAVISGLGKSFFDISESEFDIFNVKELFSIHNALPPAGTHTPKQPCGKIELRDLSFTYRGTDRPVLNHLSLTIRQGETVAIVGPNGSGKTTLAQIIAQLYIPTEGEILIDDLPAGEYDRNRLYEQISFVTQSPVQFEATAGENIALGDWKNLHDNPNAIRTLAEKTNIARIIQNMPEGFDTLLGRQFGNYDISGGQRQKLALTRALACNPDIIILDEPTASLDIHTEYELYSNIRSLVQNKTTILISHRFSTVRMADRIFVLNEGRLVESGSHEELLSKNGPYSVMFKMYEEMGATS
jgi:ATP-binding cassette subfamily B protein